jgi:hypothetical protein
MVFSLVLASLLLASPDVPFASYADVGPSVVVAFLSILSTALEFLLWLEFCTGILAVNVVNFPSATVFPSVLESLLLLVHPLFQLSLVLRSGLLLMCYCYSHRCCCFPTAVEISSANGASNVLLAPLLLLVSLLLLAPSCCWLSCCCCLAALGVV